MRFFERKNRLDDLEMQKLIVAVKKLNEVSIGARNSHALKSRLMQKVTLSVETQPSGFSFLKLIADIRKMAVEVFIQPKNAALIRRRVLFMAERNAFEVQGSFYGRFFRQTISAVLLIILGLTTFASIPYNVPVAQAKTYLSEMSGAVLVQRDGHIISGRKYLSLLPGDTLITRSGSSATVHFLDDSIGRLSENSGLEIKNLFIDDDNHMITNVQLLLKEGRMWGRVINLVDEESVFSIETNEIKATVVKKASFNLSREKNITKIAVFDNAVDLVPIDSGNDGAKRTLIAGYQAEIKDVDKNDLNLKLISDEDPEVKASKAWVAANMHEDEVYNQSIVADMTASILNAEEVIEKPAPVFADRQLEEKKMFFLEKYGDLIKAETFFVGHNNTEGLRYVQSFSRAMQNIAIDLPALYEKDSVTAEAYRQFMKEKINSQIRDMASFVPGDPLYPVKGVLESAAVLLAFEGVEKTTLKVANSSGRLIELQELIKSGKLDYARAILNDYRTRTAKLVLKINSENASEVETSLFELVVQQIKQIKVLVAIEEQITSDEFKDLKAEIRLIRKEITIKLLDALLQLDKDVPMELTTELKNLYVTYNSDDSDIDTVLAMFDQLMKRENGLNFIQPDQTNLPNELGVVVIVEEEATPDITALNAGN